MVEQSRDRLHRQQRAVKVLEQLLGRVANEKLPVISWSIAGSAAQPALIGRCDAENATDRRNDFEAWREALAASALPDEADSEGRIRLRASVEDTFEAITVVLVADV
ncbi:hypothetical protein HTZ77_20750 [Nonomuraea sp. SMC257]|uniref:Uncharacterized protein n=1 Tax=Nonomuraea montanisoli TaxID=2741721 RepID=A0A7Y6M3L4_9ACTN|nr:hypothetical protein [Nonomuraea montanisoli]NUW33843.1 hypothetical protein [Nonomuraea montanisoli]